MCITLYTNAACGFCRRAKLLRRTGRMTFPQVLVDGQPIGGYEELELFVRGQCSFA